MFFVRFIELIKKNLWQKSQEDKGEVYNYDGDKFIQHLSQDPVYIIHVNPKALAVSGLKGVSIANPISKVILRKGEVASIIYKPLATAVVGPGGIAHAESELNVYEYNMN